MKLKEILAISGQSGLYKFVAQSKNGIIVEQLGRDRVHVSDIKKVALWYNLLLEAGMTDFKDDEQADGKTQDAE